jgi:flagellar protein FliT
MHNARSLHHYESIAIASGEMLVAARAGDWDALIAAEGRCAASIKALAAEGDAKPANEQERARRVELIRKVLADDAAIRDLTQPWLRRLEDFLHSAGNARRLQNAYR